MAYVLLLSIRVAMAWLVLALGLGFPFLIGSVVGETSWQRIQDYYADQWILLLILLIFLAVLIPAGDWFKRGDEDRRFDEFVRRSP